jgi:serine/threonine-protein kinase
MLPDGRHLLFNAWLSDDLEHAKTDVLSVETGERRTILEGAIGAQYLTTGHLAYIRNATLFAQSFDPRSLRFTGPAVRVLDRVGSGADAQPFYAASANGTLVYHPGGVLMAWSEMFWSAGGVEEEFRAPPGYYADPSLSPDDRLLAVAPYYEGNQQVWVHEFARGTWAQLTHGVVANAPVWYQRESSKIIFTSVTPGQHGLDLFMMPADGTGSARLLYASAYPKYATSAAPSAGLVAFEEIRPDTKTDVWLLDLKGKPTARPFLQTPFVERVAALSPDGRWVAYGSNESGRFEVYVRPVWGAGKWLISTDGGDKPRWSHDGKRIVYRNPKGVMVVNVSAGDSFTADKPRVLIEGHFWSHGAAPEYDVTADGRRVVLIRSVRDQPRVPLVVVQNWFAELEQGVR